jgi:hypothetical protein
VEDISALSLSEIEEAIGGVLRALLLTADMLVIRLDGNKGFVFIATDEEFVGFVKKRYGGLKNLIAQLM